VSTFSPAATGELVAAAEAARDEDRQVVEALRGGDESAFRSLVAAHSPGLRRLAMTVAPRSAAAEEVVRETWLEVIRGLDRFEGRSTLRAWIYRILLDTARARAAQEPGPVTFRAPAPAGEDFEPAVEPGRFVERGRWAGHWAEPPASWDTIPQSRLRARETTDVVDSAIEALPPAQRQVIVLRDVAGLSSLETREVLGIPVADELALLHRARSRVRSALEAHLGG
jgi:RNA polymerase sigma-70 factor (ECF subfamily)